MASTSVAPRLELVWPKKDEFLLSPKDETGKPVWVPRTHPAASEVRMAEFTDTCGHVGGDADPARDNLLFTGDGLDVLRILAEHPHFRREYRGRVKCVYIDPPFNTGEAFEHYDDWMEHSTWLSFMRDRLLLIKELLAPDGSVWVHLDDTEQHRMRCLLDEVFGADRAVTTLIWQKRQSRDNRAAFSSSQDYIHVYAPAGAATWKASRNRLVDDGDYANLDQDPRGPWRSVPMSAQSGHATASQFYPITSPTGVVHSPPPGRCWTYTRERFKQLVEDDRIYWPRGGNGKPRLKRYPDQSEGLVPFTLWMADDVGDTASAKKEVMLLFPSVEAFDTPKPERLMERIIHIATSPGDLVLDCFGGSGTTAAVAHKMGRRWATSEIVPATVRDFIEPRLRKVVDGSDQGGVSAALGWAGGGGFRSVQVAGSSYDVMSDGMVLLSGGATNGTFARAMAAQLDFDFDVAGTPFCGRRGRMRLAVLDGVVGPEEVRSLAAALGEDERVTIVAKVLLPGAEEMLGVLSKGSRIRKSPRDVLADGSRRARRREAAAP